MRAGLAQKNVLPVKGKSYFDIHLEKIQLYPLLLSHIQTI